MLKLINSHSQNVLKDHFFVRRATEIYSCNSWDGFSDREFCWYGSKMCVGPNFLIWSMLCKKWCSAIIIKLKAVICVTLKTWHCLTVCFNCCSLLLPKQGDCKSLGECFLVSRFTSLRTKKGNLVVSCSRKVLV